MDIKKALRDVLDGDAIDTAIETVKDVLDGDNKVTVPTIPIRHGDDEYDIDITITKK